MKQRSLLHAAFILTITSVSLTSARAEFIVNGDFETEPLALDSATNTFSGWLELAGAAAIDAPAPISGVHSAKLVYVSAGTLQQTVAGYEQCAFAMDFETDFACNNVGAGRSFNLRLAHSTSSFHQINLRVVDADANNVGDVQVFNNSAWVTILSDAVTFSESDTSLSVNHLKIVGHYSDAIPNYDVIVTDGASVTASALGVTHYHGSPKPSTGTALRLISFETGNYPNNGSAFAVVDNVTVTNFGSVNNAPVITSQPVSRTVLEGAATVNFTAGISGTPPLFAQWQFNGEDIEGATNATLTSSTLTLTNVTQADAGSYTLVLSNAVDVVTSSNAVLTVTPVNNTAQMTNIWNLLPGERPYLAAANNTERGIAYNPVTESVLVASRADGSNTIAILDAATGAEKHLMNLSGVGGGSIDLNMIGVADDGVVFAGNATVSASSPVFTLYRWADDGADTPNFQVFIGDPADAVQPNLSWGDNMAVRGAGANTQILLAPGSGTNVALLRTSSGLDFQTEIPPAVLAISNAPRLCSIGHCLRARHEHVLGESRRTAVASRSIRSGIEDRFCFGNVSRQRGAGSGDWNCSQ